MFVLDMTIDDGYKLLKKCVDEIKRRFLANIPRFQVRVITKDGIKNLADIDGEGSPH